MSEQEILHWLGRLDFLTIDQLYRLIETIESNTDIIAIKAANMVLRVKKHLRSRGLPGVRGKTPVDVADRDSLLQTRVDRRGSFQVYALGRWRQRHDFAADCPHCLMPLAYYRRGVYIRTVCHMCGHTTSRPITMCRVRNPRRRGHGWERIKRLPGAIH